MERVKATAELEDDIGLHKKGWILQRIGWGFLFVLLVASMLGLFGTGVLSKEQVVGKEGTIYYEKFNRYESPATITFHAESNKGKIEIVFPEQYFSAMELDNIQPEPSAQTNKDGSIVYEFSAITRAQLKFHFMPKTTGKVNARININSELYSIHHFIYP